MVKKGQELRESLAEKWETSDSPLVHKVEDVKERFFTQVRRRACVDNVENACACHTTCSAVVYAAGTSRSASSQVWGP